jgi:hypothetical protein
VSRGGERERKERVRVPPEPPVRTKREQREISLGYAISMREEREREERERVSQREKCCVCHDVMMVVEGVSLFLFFCCEASIILCLRRSQFMYR